jgi:hypothetical protein
VRPRRFTVLYLLITALLTIGGSATLASAAITDLATGTVRIVAVDAPGPRSAAGRAGLEGQPLVTRALADVDGRLVDLPATPASVLHSGDTVTVRTVRTGGVDTVTSVQPTAVGPAATGSGRVRAQGITTPVTGKHTLVVLPVFWSSPDQATTTSLAQLATDTSAYWSEQSGGEIAISTTVRGWARIADPGTCDSTRIANLALAANQLTLPTGNRNHVMIYFPYRTDCGWAGLGQVGGSLLWDNGVQLTDVSAHELGHNFGLGHANTATCTDAGQRVTLSSSCVVDPYRDSADVMGFARYEATGNLNSAMADWLQLARTTTAAPGERTSVTVAPLSQVDRVRAVRVRVPTGWVYADYRPATGRDVRMPGWAGVQLHLLLDGTYPQSQLLDARPGGVAFSAVSLPLGVPWTVPGADLAITVTSISASGARLELTPTTAAAAVPEPVLTGPVPVSATSSTRSTPGTVTSATTRVSWRVPAPVSAVQLLVDGRQWSPAAVVTPSAATALSGTLVVTGLPAGRHLLTAEALDAAGRLSAPSAALSLTVDVTPPTTPAGLALSGSGVLSWRPSTDAVAGVSGYLLSTDGAKPVAIGAATSRQVTAPAGRHSWSVSAVDRVGNASSAVTLVVVRSAALRTTTVPAPVRVSPVAAGVLRGTIGPS